MCSVPNDRAAAQFRAIFMNLAQGAPMTRQNGFSDTGETPRTVRKAVRVPVKAEVRMRRSGQSPYRLVVVDMTASGCRVQFVDRPKLHEQVWLKFDHLEPLPATVCWINGFEAGLELDRPMHQAVFEHLTKQMGQ